MRLISSRTINVFVLMCSLLLLPLQQVMAANPRTGSPSADRPAVRDISLQDDGVLGGQVVDDKGKPVSEVPIGILRLGSKPKVVATSKTGDDGSFQFRGLTNGVYQVETTKSVAVFRVWSKEAAPPSATTAALVVHDDQTVRGHHGMHHSALHWFLLAVGVATAVGVPLLLDDDDHDDVS